MADIKNPRSVEGLQSDHPAVVAAAQSVATTLRDAVHLHAQVDDPNRPETIHAYQYIHADDGTSLVVWATEHDLNDEGHATIRLRAFPTVAAASEWTPRDEYDEAWKAAGERQHVEPPPNDPATFSIG